MSKQKEQTISVLVGEVMDNKTEEMSVLATFIDPQVDSVQEIVSDLHYRGTTVARFAYIEIDEKDKTEFIDTIHKLQDLLSCDVYDVFDIEPDETVYINPCFFAGDASRYGEIEDAPVMSAEQLALLLLNAEPYSIYVFRPKNQPIVAMMKYETEEEGMQEMQFGPVATANSIWPYSNKRFSIPVGYIDTKEQFNRVFDRFVAFLRYEYGDDVTLMEVIEKG